MKQMISLIIIIACIASLNAAITAITPGKVVAAEQVTVTLTALAADTTAESVIQFHTGTDAPTDDTTPTPAACTGQGTVTVTCTNTFAAPGIYNVYLDQTKNGDQTVEAKAAVITALSPKSVDRNTETTFTLTAATAGATTAATKIQVSTASSVASATDPASEEPTGLASTSITFKKTFTAAGIYNIFVDQFPQGAAIQITVSSRIITTSIALLFGFLLF